MLGITLLSVLWSVKRKDKSENLQVEYMEAMNKEYIKITSSGYGLTEEGEKMLVELENQNVKGFEPWQQY